MQYLNGDGLCAEDLLIISHVQTEGAVGGAVGQGQQVGASDKVVAVEVAEAHSPGGSHAHDCLEGRGAGQHVAQVVLELYT